MSEDNNMKKAMEAANALLATTPTTTRSRESAIKQIATPEHFNPHIKTVNKDEWFSGSGSIFKRTFELENTNPAIKVIGRDRQDELAKIAQAIVNDPQTAVAEAEHKKNVANVAALTGIAINSPELADSLKGAIKKATAQSATYDDFLEKKAKDAGANEREAGFVAKLVAKTEGIPTSIELAAQQQAAYQNVEKSAKGAER